MVMSAQSGHHGSTLKRIDETNMKEKRIIKLLSILNDILFVPSVAEWSKALESDASAGGGSPVRAPVRAATLCPYA